VSNGAAARKKSDPAEDQQAGPEDGRRDVPIEVGIETEDYADEDE
jgi:hypothetical protein